MQLAHHSFSSLQVNVISGRLYKDINANKVYDNPPDQPLANQQVHVVMGLNQTGGGGVTTAARRAARVDSTCPPIAIATTDNDGQYSAGFGTIPPKTTIWIIIPGNCSQPLVSVVSSEDGTVEDPKIEVPVDVPASSTTTGILAITTAIAAPATSTPAAIAPSTTAVVAGVTTPAVLPATTTPAPAQPTTTVVPPGTTTVSQTHTAETTSMSHTSSASATTTCAPPTVTGFPLVANGNGWADSYTSYSTYAYGAAVDASGNVYVVGDYQVSFSFIIRASDCAFLTAPIQGPYLKWDTYEMPNTTNWKMNAYIVKLNSMGHTQWAAYVDPTGLSNADDTKFQKVAVNPVDGTVWACGLTSNNETKLGSFTLSLSTTTAPSMLLAKFSPTGTVLWAYVSNGAADCKSVIVDDLGQNVYIAGEYKSGTFFGDFGPLPKYDTGVSFDFSGFVAKISTAANTFQWVATYGGQSTDYIYVDLVFSASNRIITAGEMNGNGFTYNNGTASQGTLAKGTGDTCGFVLELDTDTGNVTKALRFPSNTAGKHVSVHGAAVSNNHLFVAGHFDGDVVVDGASTSLTAAAAATYNHDIFIVKYSLSDWTFVNASRYGGDRNDKVSERFGGISIIDKATESLLLWGNSRSSWTGFNDTGSDPGCSYCMNSIVFTVDGGSMDVTAMHRLGDARNASIDYESWYGGAVASDGLIVGTCQSTRISALNTRHCTDVNALFRYMAVGYNVQPTFGPDCRWNYTNSAFRPGIDSTTEDVAIMKYNFDLTIPLPSLP